MSKQRPTEFWLKINNYEKVGMGGFRYADAEISIDNRCSENYEDFKNAIHVIEYSAFEAEQAKVKELVDGIKAVRRNYVGPTQREDSLNAVKNLDELIKKYEAKDE